MWLDPLLGGLLLVLGGIGMLLRARALAKTLPPKAPDGTMDGTLPDRGAFGLPYQRRDRVGSLRRSAFGVIAAAGAITLVSAWHLLGH